MLHTAFTSVVADVSFSERPITRQGVHLLQRKVPRPLPALSLHVSPNYSHLGMTKICASVLATRAKNQSVSPGRRCGCFARSDCNNSRCCFHHRGTRGPVRSPGHSGGPPGRPPSVQPGHKELTHATVAVVTAEQPTIFSFPNKCNKR